MACRIFGFRFSNTEQNFNKMIWREEWRSALLSTTVKLQFDSLANNLKTMQIMQLTRSYLFKQIVTECKSTIYYITSTCRNCLKKWSSFAWWLEPEVGKNRTIPLIFHWNIHFLHYLNMSPQISLELWSLIDPKCLRCCAHVDDTSVKLNRLIWLKFKDKKRWCTHHKLPL